MGSDTALISQMKKSLMLFTLLLTTIAMITLGVGGVGINNMMLVAVNERFKEIGLRKEQAENVAQEIDFRIFSQVRESLVTAALKATPETKIPPLAPTAEQPPKKPSGPDIYREPAA